MLTLILVTFVYCLCLSILKEDMTPTPTLDKVSELLILIPGLVRASDLKPYQVDGINLLKLLP